MNTDSRSMMVDAFGMDIHLIEWRGIGLPYVLLHGLGDNARVWDDFASELDESIRPIAFDLPGHGDSGWLSDQTYSASRIASHVAAAIDCLQLDHFVLIGHSLGAEVAVNLVEKSPQAALALILVDWAPERSPDAAMQVHRQLATAPRQYACVDDYVRLMMSRRPLPSREAMSRIARHDLKRNSDGTFVTKHDPSLHTMLPDAAMGGSSTFSGRRAALESALRRIDRPTLVVRGEGSSVVSAKTARTLAEHLLVKGRLAVIPKAGHGPMIDNPVSFSAAIHEFLRDVFMVPRLAAEETAKDRAESLPFASNCVNQT